MSVRRFDVYCNGGWDGCTTYEDDCDNGDYVTFADYAALLARHNALREAVAWERECSEVIWPAYRSSAYMELIDTKNAARAEVDRLIANESAADCEGEG